MKIVFTDGCVVTNLEVDGKNFSDLSTEEKREICHKLVDKMDDVNLQDTVIEFAQVAGEYKHLYTCEECGDSVCEWRVNI